MKREEFRQIVKKEKKSRIVNLKLMIILILLMLVSSLLFMSKQIKDTSSNKISQVQEMRVNLDENIKVYNSYLLINELEVNNQTNIAGSEVTVSCSSDDLVLSFFNALTDEEIEEVDGKITVPESGLKLKIDGIIEGSKYEIEIESKNIAEGYKSDFKKATIVVDATTIDVVSSYIKEVTKLVDDEEITVLGSSEDTAIFMYEEEDGKVKLYGNEDIEIYYYVSDINGKTDEELEEVEWNLYDKTEKIELERNGIIYTKSKYKDGAYSSITTLNVSNIDKLAPSVEVLDIEESESKEEASIRIKMEDQEATNDYGKSDIYGYGITIQEVEPTSFVEVNEEEVTITGITDNGKYYIWVSDNAGNVSHEEVEISVISYIQEDAVAIILSAPDKTLVGTEYTSIASLIEALEEKGINANSEEVIIQLVDDIKNEPIKIEDKNIVLDLNGYTTTSRLQESTFDVQSGSLKIVDEKYNISDYIENAELANSLNSKFDAKDGNGKVYSSNYIAVEVQEGATLTLGVDNSTGISNVEYPDHEAPVIEGMSKGILNHGGTINYYDGVIYGRSTVDGEITNTPMLYDPVVLQTEREGILQTVLEKVSMIEAMIGKTRYTKLEKAIEAANNTRGTIDDQIEIDIVTDISKDFPIEIDDTKNIKLDLNGFVLTNTISDYVIKNSGKLEIIDSAVTEEDTSTVHGKIKSNTYSTILNNMNGELTLTTGGIETTLSDRYAIRNLGTAKINGGGVKGITYGIYNKTFRYTYDEVVSNGVDCTNEVLGEIINANDNYYFVEENGTYVPNNSGIANSTANSYFKIDLGDKVEGTFVVTVNASVSSEANYDFGYATIKETNEIAPAYSDTSGRFMYIAGNVNNSNYSYQVPLEGGKIYYLYIGYRKDGSTDRDRDKVVINSIKIYGVYKNIIEAELEVNGGKVESRNTSGNSYAIYNEAKLKVTGGTIYGYSNQSGCGVYNDSSEMNITGGNFIGYTSTNSYIYENESAGLYDVSSCETFINGGTFKDGTCGICTNNSGVTNISNVTVNNCTYGIRNSSTKVDDVDFCDIISNSTISDCRYGIYNYTTGNIKVENSSINHENSNINNYIYGIYNYKNGSINYQNSNINISNVNSNPIYGIYNNENGNIEINGGKISINNTYTSGTSSDRVGLYNRTTGNIVMIKGEIEETVSSGEAKGIYNCSTGKISIGEKDGIVNNENVKITVLNSSSYSAYAVYNYDVLSELYIYEGTFIGKTEALYGHINEIENEYDLVLENIAEGEKAIIDHQTGIAFVEPNSEILYDDIQDAINACNGNGTVTLVKDSTIVDSQQKIILQDENIIINLNGKKIKTYGCAIRNSGELKLTNITEDLEGKIYGYGFNIIANESNGIMVLEKLSFENRSDRGKAIYNRGELNVESGTIKTTGVTSYGIYNENIIDSGEEVTEVIGEKIDIGEYYFEEQEGKYVSNNQRKAATANSYWKIDLREKEGLYEIIIDANISSRVNNDYGYATIKETNGVVPEYNDAEGRFVYISGTVEDTKYSLTVEGGKEYYLYLGYRRNGTASTGEDTFTINGIEVKQVKAVANIKGGKIELASQRGGGLYGVYNKKGKVNVTGGEINVSNSAGGYRRR